MLTVGKEYLANDTSEDGRVINGCLRDRYICLALENASDDGKIEYPYYLRSYIEEALDNKTFDNWLQDQGVLYQAFGKKEEHLQAHRLAWMNKMIEDFTSELEAP